MASRRKELFPNVTDAEWNDWRWQVRNRVETLEELKKYIDLIPQDFNLSNVLLSVIFERKGCRVHYIPITFRPRQGGVNSINMNRIVKIGKQALSDFRKLNKVISE